MENLGSNIRDAKRDERERTIIAPGIAIFGLAVNFLFQKLELVPFFKFLRGYNCSIDIVIACSCVEITLGHFIGLHADIVGQNIARKRQVALSVRCACP